MQENNTQVESTKAVSNGRNKRRCSNKATIASQQAPVCGLIEDNTGFTEKLSGQHNKGYIENTQNKEEQTADNQEEVLSNTSNQEVEQSEASCECSKKSDEENLQEEKHSGPSFEETKSTQKRTLEVSLKKVPHKSEKVVEKDAVSYSKVSASMNKKPQKKGLLSKIRAFFSKLIGKKSKKHTKNFKNSKGGYKKNYSKGNRRNNFDKNGNFDKNRDSSRPNNKRKNYNRRPNYSNKPKAPSATTKE